MLNRSKKVSGPSPLPPSGDPSLLSAHQQLELFKTKRLSPLDVLKAQIARIERYEPAINACTFRHFDAALAAAKRSEARYRSGDARPLEGITVAIKDEYDRAGWTVTAGSKVREHHTSEANSGRRQAHRSRRGAPCADDSAGVLPRGGDLER